MYSEPEDIPLEIITALIALGRSGVPAVAASLLLRLDAHEAHRAIVRGREVWNRVIEERSSSELRDIVMGLVRLSKTHGSLGGSVSPVIQIVCALSSRAPEWLPDLIDWVLANRVNCYEPYGTMVSIAVRDRAGVERWRGEKAARREQRRLDEIARHEGAVARHAAKATRDLANAVRRGDCLAVRALLARGANPKQALPGGCSLQALARSHAREKMADMLQELGIS